MSVICPTVLAHSAEEFAEQLEAVSSFAERIQIDLGDGIFTSATVGLDTVRWPERLMADIHLMYQKPADYLDAVIALRPHLIILHAEADGNLASLLKQVQKAGIAAGVALLQATAPDDVAELIAMSDHVLIFSGSLGSFGGRVDLSLLKKVDSIRRLNAEVEIGWDGGANNETVLALSQGGIDVLNVGGAIQKASQPANAFRVLERLVNS